MPPHGSWPFRVEEGKGGIKLNFMPKFCLPAVPCSVCQYLRSWSRSAFPRTWKANHIASLNTLHTLLLGPDLLLCVRSHAGLCVPLCLAVGNGALGLASTAVVGVGDLRTAMPANATSSCLRINLNYVYELSRGAVDAQGATLASDNHLQWMRAGGGGGGGGRQRHGQGQQPKERERQCRIHSLSSCDMELRATQRGFRLLSKGQ